METKKFFLLYAQNVETTASKAKGFGEEITALGGVVSDLNASDIKLALREADYLLCFASTPEEIVLRQFEENWRYFDNELSWKRKLSGEIVLILEGDLERYRLPFRLRDRKIISFENLSYHVIAGGAEVKAGKVAVNTAAIGVSKANKAQTAIMPPVVKNIPVLSKTETPTVTPQSLEQMNGEVAETVSDESRTMEIKEKSDSDQFECRVGTPYEDFPIQNHYQAYPPVNQSGQPQSNDAYDPFAPDNNHQQPKRTPNKQLRIFFSIMIAVVFFAVFYSIISFISKGSCTGEIIFRAFEQALIRFSNMRLNFNLQSVFKWLM